MNEENKVVLDMWVARDKDGDEDSLCVGRDRPKRGHTMWLDYGYYMELPRDKFPNIKWENEPVKVKVTIEIEKNEQEINTISSCKGR